VDFHISAEDGQFFLIRIGRGSKDYPGDFIDYIEPKLNLAVIKFPADEKIAIHGPSIKFHIENEAWTIPVDHIVTQIHSEINPNILAGLYRSTFEKNDSGLVIYDALNEECDNYFEASDQDLVNTYGDSIYGIGSVTQNLNIELNTVTGAVLCNGILYKNISELYGNFDEDAWWVIGLTF
jgi:hypothetical protein